MANETGSDVLMHLLATSAVEAIKKPAMIFKRNGTYFGHGADITINLIYVLLTLLNFIGNGLMIYLIMRHRQLRTPINFFLLNLSVSDIIAGLSIYPFVFLTNISRLSSKSSTLGLVCSLTEGLSVFFVAAGVGLSTLCAVSLYRYVVIRFPLRALWTRSKRAAKVIVAAMWIISIVVITPSAVTYRYSPQLDVCVRDWLSMNHEVYRIATLLVTIVLPTTFLCLCYLALRLARRKIMVQCGPQSHVHRIQMMKRSEQLVFLLIANFFICWTPFFIYWGLATFTSFFPMTSTGQTKMLQWVRITVLFSAINGSVDPVLFAASNKEIRAKARKVLFQVLQVRYASTSIVRSRVKNRFRGLTL